MKQTEGQNLSVKTAKNALWHISGFLTTTVLGLVVTSFVVNKIGVASFGLFGLITAILAPLTLANLGFGEATVKYVAQYVHEGDLEKAARYISTTYFMNLIVGLAGAILIALLGEAVFTAYFHVKQEDLQVVKICLYLVAIGWFCNQAAAVMVGIPAAFQKYNYIAAGNIIVVFVNSLLVLLFILSGGGLVGYTTATVVGGFVNYCYWYVIAKKVFPSAKIRPAFHLEVWKSSFHFGGWQAISQFGAIMAAQIDKYLLGVFLNPAAVGIYNIALTAEQKAYSSVFTMSEVLFPAFSSISNESLELKADALMKASWILTVAAVCVLAPLIPLATDLISVWINADVAGQGAIVLRTLCVGGILGCATSATYFFLLGTGKTRIITVMAVATGVVTVIVSAIVLPRFGLKAAGWSGIAAMIVQMMFIFAILKKIFGSILTWSHITTSLHVPIAAGLSVAFLVSGIGRPPLTTWPSLILAYAIVFVLTLVTTLAVNALMPHGRDRNMFLMSMVRSLLPGRSSAGRI